MTNIFNLLIIVFAFCGTMGRAYARPACRPEISRERCEQFDLINALRTPLLVDDTKLQRPGFISVVEQTGETVEALVQDLTKIQMLNKWSLKGALSGKLSNTLSSVEIPKLNDLETGLQSSVDAFKKDVVGSMTEVEKIEAAIDFTNPDQVALAVEQAAIVANPIGALEEQSAQERKEAFIQQSILDLTARVLFYKSELQKLKQADTDASNSNSSKDTVGTMEVSIRIKDANNRIRALLEKIEAARLELAAIQNLQSADMLPKKVYVVEGNSND